jgi:putative phage-type endonuclease
MKEINPDRTKYLGSSDAAAILGVSPWKSELSLYLEKIGEYQEEITPAKQKIFNRGKRLEPVVCAMLIDELQDRGHDVQIIGRNNRYIDPVHSFMAAEIDLELVIDGKIINGEIKTVSLFAAKHWGEPGTDEIPLHYISQVLHGQMVTGQNQTVVAALIGADDLRIHFVDRDDNMITYIRDREIAFWQRILDRNPPEATTTADISRLYSIDAGSIMEADTELLVLHTELSKLKADATSTETAIETISNQIKKRMGLHSLLVHEGQKLASWKTQLSNRFEVTKFKNEHKEMYKQYTHTIDSRVFRLK